MYKNILIPAVLDADNDNQGSFRVAQKLAGDQAKFTILHVMEPIPGFVLAEIPSDILNKAHAEVEKIVSQFSRNLSGSEAKVISGHAGRAIVDYAGKHEIDCIIVASHKPGVGDLFLGSTAARVVRHANCSVHVIR